MNHIMCERLMYISDKFMAVITGRGVSICREQVIRQCVIGLFLIEERF